MSWTISKSDSNACVLKVRWDNPKESRRILALADIHWDSALCDRDKLKADLDQALETNTPVMIFGDFFDAMQGKWDPRSSQEALREEHRGGSYLDLLVDTSFEWLQKYAPVLALISPGNHETSIQKRHEVNLTERLVTLLRREKSPCLLGTYWGFVVISSVLNGRTTTNIMHYHHGYGGGGEVSRGLIDHSRTRGQYFADIYVSGHIHRRNCDENVITAVSPVGKIQHRKQLFLRCGSYKNETDGWHAQQGRASRPIGGWWVRLSGSKTQSGWLVTPVAEAT